MGMAPPLSYAYGDRKIDVCRKLEQYAHRFFAIAPLVIYFENASALSLLNLLTHGSRLHFSGISPGLRSESNRHSPVGHCR